MVEAMSKIPRAIDVSVLKASLNLANCYRKFVASFNCIAIVLTILIKTNQAWIWRNKKKVAFWRLEDKLSSILILQRPILEKVF